MIKLMVLNMCLMTAVSGFAGTLKCEAFEAQFSGTISNYQVDTAYNGDPLCTFQVAVQPENFQYNPECPLDLAEAVQATFVDPTCSLHNGSSVSGFMVKKGDKITIE